MKTTEIDPSALYWASFNRFELRLSGAAVVECSASGDCGDAVARWLPSVEFSKRATPDAIRAELKEYGAWDDDKLADDAANRERIVWIAAGNVADDNELDCSRAVDEAEIDKIVPPLSDVGSRYGAPMGRSNTLPDDTGNAAPELYLQRLDFVDGDYDAGGAYWGGGIGDFIWRAVSRAGDVELFVRARSRRGAVCKVEGIIPNAEIK